MQQHKNIISVWLMWSLASFFYAYQYILRVLPNIMMSDILEKFQIDASLFGQYSGLYYIGYAGMHIPVGILLDKYGPKWILPLCMILTVIGLMPLLYAEHWIYPGIGRLLIGMGSSAAILGVFKIIRMSFPEDKFTFILGCSVTIGLLGAIYGGQPVNYLMHTFGSEIVLQFIILLGILLAIATFFAVPKQTTNRASQGWVASVKEVLTNPQIIFVCLFAGFMVGPLEGFADVWGKEYLKSVYKLNENVAASLPSLIFLGMCFGSPILSWITEKTKAYFGFIILSGVVMSLSFFLLLTGQLPVSLLTVMFIIVGVFCAYQILAIYKASTYGGEQLVGLTTACANMIIMTFGYVFHSVIGQIMSHLWDGTMVQDVPAYDAHAYTLALMVIPIGLMMGVFGFIWLAISKKGSTFTVQSRMM
ncbi:MAG: MFS transporter [Gammaproteobacteria bacterium]|jgi:MFS family permease|nr:MFS transporter [Gammaproteobacteria bacterium]